MTDRREIGSIEVEDQRKFWNYWNAQYREDNKPRPEVNERQARMVCEWLGQEKKRDLDILEVGCGSGWLCERLVEFGRITGTDLSNEVLARTREALPGIKFVAGDFLNLDFPVDGYDVVVSLEVLAHVPDQRLFIEKIATLLRPGGLLMLATQNRYTLERWSQVPPQGEGQIRNWVNAKKLRNLLKESFVVSRLTSIVPVGDRGILRWTNAPKLNRMLSVFFPRSWLETFKERLFLGHTLMVLAQKRPKTD